MAEPLLENCFAARAGKRRQNITFASAGEPSQMKQAFRIWLKSTPRYKLPSRLAGGAGATRIGRVIKKSEKPEK